MYENKSKLAAHLYQVLDGLMIADNDTEVSIDKLLNPAQKYSLIMGIMVGLPKTDFENVLEFQNSFKIPNEKTHILQDWEHKELRFSLLLEEVIELGFSLGFSNIELYNNMVQVYNKVEPVKPEANITNVLDALTDIIFVAYGAVVVFNLTDMQYEAMQEVSRSNLSKLIPHNEDSISVIKKSVEQLNRQGKEVISVDLKNGFYAIKDLITNKILKPISHFNPDLQSIINKYLKNN